MKFKGLFSSASSDWATPKELYEALDKEFRFNDDPCPLGGEGGLDRPWGNRTFLNPPYGRAIIDWVARAYQESCKGKLIVCLLPSRTDTKWWHDYVMQADEIRFIRGRLRFGNAKNGAPFPSAIVIFDGHGGFGKAMKNPRVKVWIDVGEDRSIYSPVIALVKGMARGAATVSDYSEFPDEKHRIWTTLKPKKKSLALTMQEQIMSYGIRCEIVDRFILSEAKHSKKLL